MVFGLFCEWRFGRRPDPAFGLRPCRAVALSAGSALGGDRCRCCGNRIRRRLSGDVAVAVTERLLRAFSGGRLSPWRPALARSPAAARLSPAQRSAAQHCVHRGGGPGRWRRGAWAPPMTACCAPWPTPTGLGGCAGSVAIAPAQVATGARLSCQKISNQRTRELQALAEGGTLRRPWSAHPTAAAAAEAPASVLPAWPRRRCPIQKPDGAVRWRGPMKR